MRLLDRRAADGGSAVRNAWLHSQRALTLVLALALFPGCVEVFASIDLNLDGSGRAAIRYALPLVFLQTGKPLIQLETNRLLPTTRAEADEIWGNRRGVRVVDFSSQDLDGDPNATIPQGVRRIELQLAFDSIEALSTGHFFFRYFPQDGKRYFVLRTAKNLQTGMSGGEQGGLGKIVGGLIAGRRLTMDVRFPDRVEETNAGSKEFARAVWTVPMGVFFNKVQDEVFMWTQMPGRERDGMREAWWALKRWYRGEDWANADVFPSYVYMPYDENKVVEEPTGKPRPVGAIDSRNGIEREETPRDH